MIIGYNGHILVCYGKDTFDKRLVPSYSWLPPPVSVTHRMIGQLMPGRLSVHTLRKWSPVLLHSYKLKWSGIFKMATSKKIKVAEEC